MRRASRSHPAGLTQAQYARRRGALGLPGGTREAVRKAVAEGRIQLLGNRHIEPRAADAAWAERSLPKFGVAPDSADGLAAQLRLVSTRSDREYVRKQLDEIRLLQATGILVRADEIFDAATAAARTAHERLAALAKRLGPVVASRSDPDECIRIIESGIEQACAGLAKPLELLPGGATAAAAPAPVPGLPPLPPPLPPLRGRYGR